MAGTSGKAAKCDIKKKGKGTKYVKNAELGGFQMFMITDHMVRFFQAHPRFKTGEDLMTKETADEDNLAGSIEWWNMSDTEKAEWIEKYNNMIAEGKSLFSLRNEYRPLYQQQSK